MQNPRKDNDVSGPASSERPHLVGRKVDRIFPQGLFRVDHAGRGSDLGPADQFYRSARSLGGL